MGQTGLSAHEIFGCPGPVTDEIIQKAQAAVIKARPAADPEQLAKTKAEALHEMEKTYFAGFESGVRYASEKADFKQEQPAAGPDTVIFVYYYSEPHLRKQEKKQIEDIYHAGFRKGLKNKREEAAEKEQPLGTVAEPADPPPASELPKTGMAKIKVKIAMNLDLIAEYLCVINGLVRMENDINVAGKEIDNLIQDRDFVKNSNFQLAEKKSALEAKIMEKIMAK